jgi:hypothetical protein
VLDKGIRAEKLEERLFVENQGDKLKIIYRPRGPAKAKTNILINRFIPIDKLGWLAGFIQSEGIHTHAGYFGISNYDINTLVKFLEATDLFGISRESWHVKYVFAGNEENRLKLFVEKTGISNINQFSPKKLKKANSFFLFLSGTIYHYLFKVLLRGVKEVILSNKNYLLARSFISSLFAGDGYINVIARKFVNSPYLHTWALITITDESYEYREDYIRILKEVFGIKARNTRKRVVIGSSFDNLLKLVRLGAFKEKRLHRLRLLYAFLKKRKTKSLEKLVYFSTPKASPIYWRQSGWLGKQIKAGLLRKIGGQGTNRHPFIYELTLKGKKILESINRAKEEAQKLMSEMRIKDLNEILELKTIKGTSTIYFLQKT